MYIPPTSSCNGRYSPPIDHLLTGTDSLVLGDFNAHHSLWHSGTTDSRGNELADSVSISSFAVLNTDSPTRLPGNADPSSPDVSLASASLITSSEWQIHTTMSSDNLPILIGLQTTATSSSARHTTYINLKKADWTGYRQEIERKLSSRHLPTDCQKDEKLFRATLLKATSHPIPTGSPSGDLSHDGGARRPTQAGSRLAPAVDNEWWDHQRAIGSQKKTVERIRWEHRPQDRQHQAVEDDQRNWRQIQADGREWGHYLHRKIQHLTQADCQQFQPSVHHF